MSAERGHCLGLTYLLTEAHGTSRALGRKKSTQNNKKPEPRRRAGLRLGLLNFLICWCSSQEEMPPIMGGSELYLWAGMTPFVPLCQQHREALFRVMWPGAGKGLFEEKKRKNPEQCLPSRQLLPTQRCHPLHWDVRLLAGAPCCSSALSTAGRAGSWRGQVCGASS